MIELSSLARIAALIGVIFLILAGVLSMLDRADLPLGNLPGDLRFKWGNFTCAVPIVASLLISILLTLILNLVLSILNK